MKDNNKYVQVLLRHSISICLNNKYKLIFKKKYMSLHVKSPSADGTKHVSRNKITNVIAYETQYY